MKNRFVKSLVLVVILMLVSYRQAYAAYIDPNTGGMVFQLLAVLFGVISGVILLFSSRIKATYYRIRRGAQSKQTPEEDSGEV